ncbi:MAG: helix-turn-helix transcriptional regulator [Hyphomonadaceae bacterium]
MDDTRRVIAARRLIDERWGQKLTLDGIARACGLNRAKLTRGFRDLFGCTVAEALAERRLHQARHMLLTTDLPVSSIGYENGYLNNASFARAFGRRFGVSPSDLRACAAA